jgi:transcription elongation factor Elf1
MQIGLDMITFDETYRTIRANHRYQGFSCYVCNKSFKDGDKISLIITDKGNKVVCHGCGVDIKHELEVEGNE